MSSDGLLLLGRTLKDGLVVPKMSKLCVRGSMGSIEVAGNTKFCNDSTHSAASVLDCWYATCGCLITEGDHCIGDFSVKTGSLWKWRVGFNTFSHFFDECSNIDFGVGLRVTKNVTSIACYSWERRDDYPLLIEHIVPIAVS